MPNSERPEAVLSPQDVALLASGLATVACAPASRNALKRRVLERALDSRAPNMSLVHADEGEWLPLLPLVSVKPLRIDRRRGTQTSLWRLEPGAELPEHEHSDDEECLIVKGSIQWDDKTYREGDYLLAMEGLHHTRFKSRDGALLLIRSDLSPQLERAFAGR